MGQRVNNLGVHGSVVATMRERLGLTQGRLAALVGMNQSNISRLEKGSLSDLKVATLQRLAAVLEVPVGVLIGELPPPAPLSPAVAEIRSRLSDLHDMIERVSVVEADLMKLIEWAQREEEFRAAWMAQQARETLESDDPPDVEGERGA